MKGYYTRFQPEAANLFVQLISTRSVVVPGYPAGPFYASIPAEGEGSFVAWPMTRLAPRRPTIPI
jgi:hypothetical protein